MVPNHLLVCNCRVSYVLSYSVMVDATDQSNSEFKCLANLDTRYQKLTLTLRICEL